MGESVIAIKDFSEMPKGCSTCLVMADGDNYCSLIDEFIWDDDFDVDACRHVDCPLIEVPDHVG